MMIVSERWMQAALLCTGVMNLFGCVSFAPPITFIRYLMGIPEAHSFYLWLVTLWIAAFGVIFLYLGIAAKADKAFLTIAAV